MVGRLVANQDLHAVDRVAVLPADHRSEAPAQLYDEPAKTGAQERRSLALQGALPFQETPCR
ncbi:hypothetical protein [Streptomyces sp. NPDC051016]|uniref:hypothetical protein n=1 Tax=Streptomyces sp. NPDC051016 TaxID=3365638 RepID=UPI003799085E